MRLIQLNPVRFLKQIPKKAARLQANTLQIHNKRTSSLHKDRKEPLCHAQMPSALFLLFPDFYPSETFVSVSLSQDIDRLHNTLASLCQDNRPLPRKCLQHKLPILTYLGRLNNWPFGGRAKASWLRLPGTLACRAWGLDWHLGPPQAQWSQLRQGCCSPPPTQDLNSAMWCSGRQSLFRWIGTQTQACRRAQSEVMPA